ncbi:DNA polymerase III subunit gamma/tau [uncultured Enterococcus sp.]|uniref:DNA polymerase III subunit gamma/tau n=1 Tax=uncultured Enterococcus sp. TaxID=167972 RepID=UPI002AA8CAE4|nr:DNA polymerase III subunit gamma/tau [uncultured Enterococcus sp.]
MAYQALYRVWRSQRFEDIVGQKAVTQTLKNAIMQHKTSHAYLFTGPRGTGKTSAAKIFAKAINCPNSVDGEPCNECDICKEITEGRLNDVIEIDAASNNGVEEIRDIRDKAKYAPTQAEYKVYIVDEVHMLSTGAFNALLKTLEEPPKNVIFILATTEPHKIPLTIISRTQRFDFKRIGTQDIVDHLAHILIESSLKYEEQALYTIARAAEGGMRDALSILDQALSFSEDEVTLADALQVTGSLTFDMMDRYISSCITGNVEQGLETLEAILNSGTEASRFLEDILLYCRDLLMYQQAPKLLEGKTGTITETFKELAQQTEPERIYQLIQILSETQNEIRFTNHATIYLEVGTVKLAQGNRSIQTVQASAAAGAVDSEAVAELRGQIQKLQLEIEELKKNGVSATQETTKAPARQPAANRNSFKVPTERVYQVLREATREHLEKVKDVWEDLLQMLSVSQRAILKATEPVAGSPTSMVLAFDYEIFCGRAASDSEIQLAIQNNLSRLINYTPEIVCITRESWPSIRKTFIEQNKGQTVSSEADVSELDATDAVQMPEDEQESESSNSQEVIDQAMNMFGADIVEVVND